MNFRCDYCFAKAVNWREEREQDAQDGERDQRRRPTKRVWPPTCIGTTRTHENVLDIAENLETCDNTKGVLGKSILFDIEDFDVVQDVPAEYMHLVCIGFVKKLTELTFLVGKHKNANINYRRVDPKPVLDVGLLSTKVPSESSRRTRILNFASYKAQEWRNLILWFFSLVIQSLDPITKRKERQLWVFVAFYIRAYVLSDDEFDCVEKSKLKVAQKQIYELFVHCFGEKNCSHNVHVFSHLDKVRKAVLTVKELCDSQNVVNILIN